MRWICLVLLMFVCVLLDSGGAFCGGLDHDRTTQQVTSAVPLVQIEGASTFSQDRPLAFRCKIRNPGSELIRSLSICTPTSGIIRWSTSILSEKSSKGLIHVKGETNENFATQNNRHARSSSNLLTDFTSRVLGRK